MRPVSNNRILNSQPMVCIAGELIAVQFGQPRVQVSERCVEVLVKGLPARRNHGISKGMCDLLSVWSVGLRVSMEVQASNQQMRKSSCSFWSQICPVELIKTT